MVESTSTQSLKIENVDISTAQGALQAVDDFEQASQTLNAARGQVGAVGNRLVSTSNSLNIQIENLTQSESGLADTDLAEEVSNLQQELLRFETSIRPLASQLQNEQSRPPTGFHHLATNSRWPLTMAISDNKVSQRA